MALNRPKRDILILYNGSDADEWKQYLLRLINVGLEEIECDFKDVQTGVPNDIMKLCDQYHLLTLLVSPKMLDTLELDNLEYLRPFINAHDHVAVIRLFLREEDLVSIIKDEYQHTEQWTMLQIGNDSSENNKMMSELMDRLQSAKTQPTSVTPTAPTPTPSRRGKVPNQPSDKKMKSTVVQAVSPEQIKTAGELVTLVFWQPYEDGTIQVTFDKDKEESPNIVDTTRLNPYCYQFKAPAHKPGSLTVRVYVDGKKKTKVFLKYMKPWTYAYTSLEYLCQVLNIEPKEDIVGLLDKKLSQIFMNSTPGDNSLPHILSPKYLFESTQGKISDDLLPTLLHFACYYGLQDLASCVMDMPGSAAAFDVLNCDNKNPLELAREENHQDLADYIEAFLEMQDYIDVCGDIYEKMNNQSLGDGYLDMRGCREEVPSYGVGRVPVTGEDDYMLTDVPSKVEEVLEEEDITAKPQVPARNARQKQETNLKPNQLRKIPPPPPPEPAPDSPLPTDDDFFKPIPLPSTAMGSSNLAEIIDMQEMFKQEELTSQEIEKLYGAWMERNKTNQTASVKERKAQIDKMKNEFCKPLLKKQGKKGLLSHFTQQKSKPVESNLDIQHHATPNKYSELPVRFGGYHDNSSGNRDSYGSNRDSVSSTTSSSSSGSSRDSGLDPIKEFDLGTDETAPPVPARRDRNSTKENRNSLGKAFLENVQKPTRSSRLPPIPTIPAPIQRTKPRPQKKPERKVSK